MKSAIIALPALASLAAAATHMVTVGPGLNYSPDSVTADAGDVIAFSFSNNEHNVVEGAFNSPCMPSGDNAVYSGTPNAGQVFSVTVNSTDPLYFYCSVPGHCESGMVMAVNAPSSGNTLDAYKSAAGGATGSSQPANVQGGVFGSADSSSSTTVSGTHSSTATMSATSSGASASSTKNAGAALNAAQGMTLAGVAGAMAFFL